MRKDNKARETLQAWLDSNGMEYPKEIAKTIEKNGQQHELKKVLGHLWSCTDVLPATYCRQLDIPLGSSYAQAVRSLFKQLKH